MSDPKAPEFAGTDEELEKYLGEFARAVGGWAMRDPKRGGPSTSLGASWRVASGSLLSTNPNTLAWQLRVARDDGRLSITPAAIALPWMRAKVARVVAFRHLQLADFLTSRVRGGGKEKFDALRLREPYATFGSDPAALTASFAWSVLCALGAMGVALVATTLACIPLMNVAIGEILQRAAAAQGAGAVAIPSPDRALSAVGAAFVFAGPLAFFAGLVHTLALAASELWARASRLPQASVIFIALLLAAAFFPYTPLLAIPIALAVPLAIHAGYTIAWSRRRERVREGPRPRKALLVAGALLAALTAAALVPTPAEGRAWTDRLALFRDRTLLGHPLGRLFASIYYRHTLVGAELLKQFYSEGDREPAQMIRTAIAPDPQAAAALRAMHFAIVPTLPADLQADSRVLRSGSDFVPWDGSPDSLPAAVDRLAREAFRGSILREVAWISWRSVYYAGPLFLVAVFIGFCCPGFSIIFRVMRPKAALVTILFCFASTAALMLVGQAQEAPASEAAEKLREAPEPKRLAEGLAHRSPLVRHEAAFRAFLHPDPSLGEPLLKATDDEDLRVRLWAVAALGKTGHPEALGRLLGRLNDREFYVRYRAAEGLGFLKRPEAIEPLLRLAREGSWYEGLYALEALRLIDPKRF